MASQINAPQQAEVLPKMASQKVEKMASQKNEQLPVKVKASEGKGQKSKTVNVNGLKFRVRLNDRSYRVMLLAADGEPYLCSLRHSEWQAIADNPSAFLEKVKEKLRARIVKADDTEAAKLKTLLATIEEKSR
ncbi:MAG: hypothetical protein SF097_14825 [Acidobacteriota bacterium]|nr:hypothetical protein [Acidobacteriota bacterium]